MSTSSSPRGTNRAPQVHRRECSGSAHCSRRFSGDGGGGGGADGGDGYEKLRAALHRPAATSQSMLMMNGDPRNLYVVWSEQTVCVELCVRGSWQSIESGGLMYCAIDFVSWSKRAQPPGVLYLGSWHEPFAGQKLGEELKKSSLFTLSLTVHRRHVAPLSKGELNPSAFVSGQECEIAVRYCSLCTAATKEMPESSREYLPSSGGFGLPPRMVTIWPSGHGMAFLSAARHVPGPRRKSNDGCALSVPAKPKMY